jgi:CO dehydrogenase/acetyl-CoA synthase beta subunit
MNQIGNQQELSPGAGEGSTDHDAQIRKLREILDDWSERVVSTHLDNREAFVTLRGLTPRGGGAPTVVVGDQVGADLGRPGTASHSLVLTTRDPSRVKDGWVRVCGPDLDQVGVDGRASFAQVVILSLGDGASSDPFELDSTQYLANRLPGYMARTVPGRLWVRASREAIQNGFRLQTLGYALVAAYRMDFPDVTGAEVILVTGPENDVRRLDTVAAEARVISGRHRKLSLVEKGVYECADLDCDSCEDKEVCDALKDVTIRYRTRSAD